MQILRIVASSVTSPKNKEKKNINNYQWVNRLDCARKHEARKIV